MTFGGMFRAVSTMTAAGIGMAIAVPAQAAAPVPGPIESYRDWVVGCDNIGSCTAASLFPEKESGAQGGMTVYVRRDAGPAADPRIELLLPEEHDGPVDLLVDGVKFASAQAQGNSAPVAPAASAELVKGMVRGMVLSASARGRTLGAASLSGASAALRYMDAQQGRAGTVTGLVAKGRLRADAVRAAGSLPSVSHLPVPQGLPQPSALWREERGRALALSGCGAEQGPTQEAQIARLSEKEELVLIPCGAGAYNFSSVPLIATGQAGRRAFRLARFDSQPGWSEPGGPPMLVNAGWDATLATLSSFAKGRGLGDCGSAESYVWDGSVFRLVELRRMDQCRGAWEWITLWRARPVVATGKK